MSMAKKLKRVEKKMAAARVPDALLAPKSAGDEYRAERKREQKQIRKYVCFVIVIGFFF